jgi:hypothetical protein
MMPNAVARRCSGTASRTIAAPFGKDIAPASACCIRKRISTGRLGANAQPADATANQASPIR